MRRRRQQQRLGDQGSGVQPLRRRGRLGKTDGTPVQLYDCFPNNGAQQWVVNSDGSIVNPNSGKCLDAVEFGTTNGTRLQIWECGRPLGGNQQ